MSRPLLELKQLTREFPAGEATIAVLRNINLTIEAGEMVAITGPSGSGKSTLMNILGCLDRPTHGSYCVEGRDISSLNRDELATLRREHFGFIFQRYHLLPDLTALSNVEMPAIYAGKSSQERLKRAEILLARLGLNERLTHKPNQLSGGQQQRVSIARALMNGGKVILADEPTGALDRHSGQEMLKLLEELNREGHTVIIVTHDMDVAAHARRIIKISDGEITDDSLMRPLENIDTLKSLPLEESSHWQAALGRMAEAFYIALLAMASHRLRTFLTMLGIIIGIASVISVVALGEGSKQKILESISSIGTNTIDIFPGKDFGDEKASTIHTLLPTDADTLAEQSYIDSATPVVSSSLTLRYRNISVNATITGVGTQYFKVKDMTIASGTAFSQESVQHRAQEAVIDENTQKKLFGDNTAPIGEVIFLGTVPCRIVGIVKQKESGFGNNENLNIWVPYTMALTRIIGQSYLKSITVRISDDASTNAAEQGIEKFLTQRHLRKDFFLFNTANIRQTIESASTTMRILTAMIAVISLIVGGIGVMNIMLVSVTERTKEIGVRMAVGARQSDILTQFLIEAVMVCLLAGALGILLALSFGTVFSRLSSHFTMVYSMTSIFSAFACSTLIGIAFGFLPARNAAGLDPIEALARE